MREPHARVGALTLLRVLCRCFFVQAALNYERMQNVGFGFCMAPALNRLYQGPELSAALSRHVGFFNSHPYLTSALIGASVRLEENVAAGVCPPENVTLFKQHMMGPVAAIGDSFFWASLRPLVAVWAIVLLLVGVPFAPLAFLLLYSAFHLGIRVFGLFAGYYTGDRVFECLSRLGLVRAADAAHYFTAVLIGVATALFLDGSLGEARIGDGLDALLMIALTFVFFLSLKRKFSIVTVFYGMSLLCIGSIWILNAHFPLL